MKTLKTKRIFILLLLILSALIIIFVGLIFMIFNKEEQVILGFISSDSNKIAEIFVYERILEENQEKIDLINSIFIAKEREIDFLEEIEEVGRNNNVSVTISDVQVEDVNGKISSQGESGEIISKNGRTHGEVVVNFRAEGQRGNLINFIGSLLSMNRKIEVNKLRLSISDGEEALWGVSLEIIGLSN